MSVSRVATPLPRQQIESASIEPTPITAGSHLANASWNIGGIVGYNAARWVTVVAIARLGGATLLGEFALATAIVVPFFLFANLQLPGLLATDAARKVSGQAYLLVGAGGSVVALSLAVLFGFQEGRAIAMSVALFAIARSIDSMSELIGGSLQRSGRFRPIAIGQVLNGVLTAAVSVAVLLAAPSTPALAIASIIGSAIAWAFIFQHVAPGEWLGKKGAPHHVIAESRALLRLGLPMGCAAGLIGLGTSLPTLVLDQWVDKVQVGIFSAISLPVAGLGMVVAAASQVAAPRLATLVNAGDHHSVKRHIASLITLGSSLGLLTALASIAAGGWFLATLYGEEYRQVANVLVILCLAAAVRCGYWYVGVVLMVIRKPQIQLYARIPALVVLGLALYLLIPRYGITGAAWAILVATMVEACAWAAILGVTWRTLNRGRSAVDDC